MTNNSSMLFYAITDRVLLAAGEAERQGKLVDLAAKWAANQVDFIQLREKDLADDDLTGLADKVVRVVGKSGDRTQVLINASPKTAAAVGLASGADGIHISGGLTPEQLDATISRVREMLQAQRTFTRAPTISVSCHSVADVEAARAAGATLALFGPVFEKVLSGGSRTEGAGLGVLAKACRAGRQPGPRPEMPVLALGGVTVENAPKCVEAGAAGIAAIRLFLNEGDDGCRSWRVLSTC